MQFVPEVDASFVSGWIVKADWLTRRKGKRYSRLFLGAFIASKFEQNASA